MTQEIEIEFKNMLTKTEYEALLQHFNINYDTIQAQVNHYFDTPDERLKQHLSGLRIRQTTTKIVCTIKERSSEHGHLETTDTLTKQQAEKMLLGEGFFAPEVEKRLQLLEVDPMNLHLIGTLSTKRVELELQGGTLVLDHSLYLNCDDYEVEYEANDEKLGQQIFQQFLVEHSIPVRPADKKIARFMQALKSTKQ